MCRWYWRFYILCQHHGKKRIPCDMSRRLRWHCEGWRDADRERQMTTITGSSYTPAVMKLCPDCRSAEQNSESR
ncbi:uncharacterized protein M437DRAFT_47223 [Aureobasidium melanogenum CBS 110374]|uniref:Uncharacterized protein n=1 Tax=Aureobasidium melanogenum (strain CBS 110374) TaxID=1043003 RepID=A0A074VRL9_AURM1|nr:uncharacterized protein M437DRAFT_47223 [Aureobasidium melanogenum CBS 110374]KEQ63395.1 hypothetical protein M437DRAFT_47223 [Aureobasidium melanogenum CBS 110374]